jgi:hypothetical protein
MDNLGRVQPISISCNDPRFIEATSSTEPVFPSSKEENFAIISKDKDAGRCFDEGDFQAAQTLGDEARQLEKEKILKDTTFELVQRCAKDAQGTYTRTFSLVFVWSISRM